MSDAEELSVIEKIYAEILSMKEGLDEIRSAIIHEDEPDEEEIRAYNEGMKDASSGNVRSWDDVKRDLGV